jgi:hypothetical protein
MTDSSADDGKIYQQRPAYSKPSQYKLKGWCETTVGAMNEGRKLAMCLMRNRHYMHRPYAWAAHINIDIEMSPQAIVALWIKACRILKRRGIVALWLREPNRANKVHYHLLVKSPMSRRAVEQAIEDAMPSREIIPWRKRVESIRKEGAYCRYIAKAKVAGIRNGRCVADLYARKRLLFKPNLKLKKYGVIGNFWEPGKSKEKLWQEIKDFEARIAEGLEYPRVSEAAKDVYEFLGGCIPLNTIERSFGYLPNHPSLQHWIDSLQAGAWPEVK